MDKEISSFKTFNVKHEVPEGEAQEAGVEVIPTRWILHDRLAKGIKARLVVQQITDGSIQDRFHKGRRYGARIRLDSEMLSEGSMGFPQFNLHTEAVQ